MRKCHINFNLGFTLVELVFFITISSILTVALFAALRGNISNNTIDTRDMVLIGANAGETFRSWLMKGHNCTTDCPTGIPTVLGYTANCDIFPNTLNPVLCRNNLGNLTKYIIQADVSDTTLAPNTLTAIPAWELNLTIQFFTKNSPSSDWALFNTYNTSTVVIK